MRVRLLALLSAAALFGLAAMPASASSEGHGYLALGDSVAFGYSPLVDPRNAANFTGYPEIVAQKLNIEDVNVSCPGEATGGFIDPQGLDNSCRSYRAAVPLHVKYTGTQLAFAISYLKANPRTRLVTINLDANDLFRLTSGASSDFWPPSTCYTPDLVLYFQTCAVQNLQTIFAALRGTGYNGLIVAMTYYSLDYSIPLDLFTSSLLNTAMTTAAGGFDVLVASGFDAWQPVATAFGGSSCAAGLLIPVTGGCNIHPSPKGRDLLAAAIVDTIANSCPAHSPIGCLDRNEG